MTYKLKDLRREDNRLPGQLDPTLARTMPAFTKEAAHELNRRLDEADDMLIDDVPHTPYGYRQYDQLRSRRNPQEIAHVALEQVVIPSSDTPGLNIEG